MGSNELNASFAARASRRLFASVIPLALLACLNGCGQKGPLYVPDEGGDVVTRPAPAGQTQQTPRSPETAPQPSTQPPPNRTDSEKKTPTPR
jgi:predicted small lipoprotein YifL